MHYRGCLQVLGSHGDAGRCKAGVPGCAQDRLSESGCSTYYGRVLIIIFKIGNPNTIILNYQFVNLVLTEESDIIEARNIRWGGGTGP